MRVRASAALALVVACTAASGGARPTASGTAVVGRLTGELALYRVDLRSGRVVRLSPGHDARDSQPTCSPDGRRIVFVRETINGAGLYELPAAGGVARKLISADSFAAPAWSPDGRLVAFTDAVDGLRLLDLAHHLVHVLSRGYDEDPSWSPDGTHLAFDHDRTGNGDTSIWTMRRDGTGRRQITHPPGGAKDRTAAWSPDGKLIAFQRDFDIWTVAASGGSERLVVRDATNPTWSPDGRSLLVDEVRHPFRDTGLYEVTRSAGAQRLVVRGVWEESCWLTPRRRGAGSTAG
jgi:Tol biopolymer transport system component